MKTFEPVKNGLKIAFHSNDTALELKKKYLKALIIQPPNSRILGLF